MDYDEYDDDKKEKKEKKARKDRAGKEIKDALEARYGKGSVKGTPKRYVKPPKGCKTGPGWYTIYNAHPEQIHYLGPNKVVALATAKTGKPGRLA